MFGFSAGTMFMGGGGSSGGGGGGGGIGAPGSDVGRGGGGRAGSNSSPGGGGGRDDNDRGPGTNPGRPGGESGMRGPSSSGGIGAPGSDVGRGGGGRAGSSSGGSSGGGSDRGGSSNTGPGTNPGRPGGESGMRSAGSSSGTNNESVSGSSRARDNFGVTNRSSSNMMSFGSLRDANVGTVGGFRGTRSLGGRGNSSLSAGAVTDGLDRSMGVYDAVVGDGELTAAEQEREALARDLAGTPPGEIAKTRSIGANMTQEAFDSRAKMPFGLIGTGLALARNLGMAGEIQSDLEALEDSRSMPDGTFDATRAEIFSGLNSDSLNATSGGFFGDGLAGQRAIMGNAPSAPSSNSADVNRGGGGGNDGPTTPPAPTVPAPTQPSESGETETGPYGGSLGDYSSYARRFFSRV